MCKYSRECFGISGRELACDYNMHRYVRTIKPYSSIVHTISAGSSRVVPLLDAGYHTKKSRSQKERKWKIKGKAETKIDYFVSTLNSKHDVHTQCDCYSS